MERAKRAKNILMSGRIGACENEEVLAAKILLLPFGMGKLGEESQFPIGVESSLGHDNDHLWNRLTLVATFASRFVLNRTVNFLSPSG